MPIKFATAALFIITLGAHALPAQTSFSPSACAAKENAALIQMLFEKVDLNDTDETEHMSLREFLVLIVGHYEERGKRLVVSVDTEAFKAENPDGPDIYDSQISLLPRRLGVRSGIEWLRLALQQLPDGNAAFLLRRGVFEISTVECTAIDLLLAQGVFAKFERQPLRAALQELSAISGVNIILDPYCGAGATTPVTATFRGDFSVQSAVALVSHMAGLQHFAVDEGLYVTTAARGRLLQDHLWQQQAALLRVRLAQLPAFQRPQYALLFMGRCTQDVVLRALRDADAVIRWSAQMELQRRADEMRSRSRWPRGKRIINDPFS